MEEPRWDAQLLDSMFIGSAVAWMLLSSAVIYLQCSALRLCEAPPQQQQQQQQEQQKRPALEVDVDQTAHVAKRKFSSSSKRRKQSLTRLLASTGQHEAIIFHWPGREHCRESVLLASTRLEVVTPRGLTTDRLKAGPSPPRVLG